MKWWTFGLVLLAIPLSAQKNSLRGIVIDKETRQPVPFANVFFANSTIGVSSDQDGRFLLAGFVSGKYDVMVTFVGYTNFQQGLEFNDSNLSIAVELEQNYVVLNEIIVKEDTTDRAKNLATFKHFFLGETNNAKSCKLLNPDVIHLFYDTKNNVLVAHAKEPIRIENKALGYSINYYLYNFELNYNTRRLSSFGIPSFQNLLAKKQSQKNHWNKEREKAYQGSVNHFMRAFRANELEGEGFEVRRLNRIPNPKRPPQTFLDSRINELRKTKNNSDGAISKNDSLTYYLKLKSLPELVDSLTGIALRADELLTADFHVNYKGLLSVKFKKEKEEYAYMNLMGHTKRDWQRSVIHFLSESLKLYPNGYYEDPRGVFIENYWAWSEKVSELLPIDYRPSKTKK